jgi:hypothetical protein
VTDVSEDLRRLITQLWGGGLAADTVAIGWDSTVPAGWSVAERYAIAPNREHARFLIPRVSPRVTAATLLRYNGLRSGRVRLGRAVLGAAARLGLPPAPHHFTVLVRDDLSATDRQRWLLTDHLAALLGRPRLHAAIGVLSGHHKPTLQLFDDAGESVGYAKVGWNEATRALVATEAEALATVRSGANAASPALLASGRWQDLTFVVSSPLPSDARARRGDDPPPVDCLRELVPPTSEAPVRDAPHVARLRAEMAELTHQLPEDRLEAVATKLLDSLAAGDPVAIGRWHGDWVPWNLCEAGGKLYAWDWEHSRDGVPFGLDVLHWLFQIRVVREGRPVADVVAELHLRAPQLLHRYGATQEQASAFVRLYLAEMLVRSWRSAAAGSGWPPFIYPQLVDAAS